MNKTKFLLMAAICVIAIGYSSRPAFGDPPVDAATCAISVTVDSIVEWEGANFAAINLNTAPVTGGHIIAQNSHPEGSAVYTLWTNSNVNISADDSNVSQLKHTDTPPDDTLVTKYKMSTDGDGVAATGAQAGAITASSASTWTTNFSFLATPLAITHINTDGAVEVTLYAQATNDSDNVADTGDYTATITITATWTSDN